jgi:hypothetical protein
MRLHSSRDTGSRELLLGDGFFPLRRFSRIKHPLRLVVNSLHQYLHSFDGPLLLALFNSTAVALVSHKVMIIRLHSPLSRWGLTFTGPCLFVFDFLVLVIIHLGLASTKIACRGLAGVAAILIMICSAAFASLYIEGNAELNWSRSVEVSFLNSLC